MNCYYSSNYFSTYWVRTFEGKIIQAKIMHLSNLRFWDILPP